MSNSPVRRPVSQVEDFKARFGVVQGQRRSEHRQSEQQGYQSSSAGFSSRQIIAAIALASLAGMSGAGVFWFAQDFGSRGTVLQQPAQPPPVTAPATPPAQAPAVAAQPEKAAESSPQLQPSPQQGALLQKTEETDSPVLAAANEGSGTVAAPIAAVTRQKIQDKLQPEPEQAPEAAAEAESASAPPAGEAVSDPYAAPAVQAPAAPAAVVVEPAPAVPPSAEEPAVAAAPVIEPAPEQVAAAAPLVEEPVSQPVAEAAPVVEPVAEAVPAQEPAPEPEPEPAPEAVADTGPAPALASEPAPAPAAEQVSEPAEEIQDVAQAAPAVVVAPAPQPAPEPRIVPGQVWRDCDACPEMVAVIAPRSTDPGNLQFAAESEATGVQPFAIGRFEITFDDWSLCVLGGACAALPADVSLGAGTQPVINVSYRMIAEQYLPWLSKHSGKAYRLPTSQEWDIAEAGGAAGVNLGLVAPSSQGLCRSANFAAATQTVGAPCDDPFPQSAPVGSYQSNAIGLHDMRGNVWEWVSDCWTPGFNYKTKPSERDCRKHVVRGGSWSSQPALGAVAPRGFEDENRTAKTIGFRVARTLP